MLNESWAGIRDEDEDEYKYHESSKDHWPTLSLVSRAMLDFHGRTTSSLFVHWRPNARIETLASLVQRYHRLESLGVDGTEGIPALLGILTPDRLH